MAKLLVFAIGTDDRVVVPMNAALPAMQAALTGGDWVVGVELITKGAASRRWLTPGQMTSEPVAITNSNDPACLREFLDAAKKRPETGPTVLIIFAHGDGLDVLQQELLRRGPWPSGRTDHWPEQYPRRLDSPYRLGGDPNNPGFLTNVGLREGLEGGDVDVLALNACIMADLEIAYEVRNACGVYISSQRISDPWDYGDIVSELCKRSPPSVEDIGGILVDCIVKQVVAQSDAISACRTGVLDDFFAAFDAFSKAVLDHFKKAPDEVVTQILDVFRGNDGTMGDVGSGLTTLAALDPAVDAAAKQARALYGHAIYANATPKTSPLSGLSVMCPDVSMNIPAAYKDLAFASNTWHQVLVDVAPLLPKLNS